MSLDCGSNIKAPVLIACLPCRSGFNLALWVFPKLEYYTLYFLGSWVLITTTYTQKVFFSGVGSKLGYLRAIVRGPCCFGE